MNILINTKVKYLFDNIFKGSNPKYEESSTEYIILGQRNNSKKGIDFNECKFTNQYFFETRSSKEFLRYGDILINSLGGGTCGRVGFYNIKNQKILSDGIPFILRNEKNNKYLFYLLKSKQNILEDIAIGATNQVSLKDFDLLNLQVAIIPDQNEQKLIADFLDTKCAEIDGITKDLQTQIETLENYKKSVITEAVTKGLNPNVDYNDNKKQWFRGIPKHWIVSRIAAIYKLRNTKVSDRDYPPLSVTMQGVVPQLENAAKTDAHDDRKLVCKGDFAINSRSDRRGSCGIAPMDGSISLINTVLCPLTNMNARYYNWLFHTVEFADEFYKWGHGIVNDLWTTNWQDMKNILIPRPPINEQKEIANYLDEKCAKIDEIIKTKQEQLETIEEYKKSLIHEYVTGKKEVKNA